MTNLYRMWAEVLAGYCTDVQPGDQVAIIGGVAAEPLLRAVQCEVIHRGGNPVLVPEFTGITSHLLEHGSDAQLEYLSPVERFTRETADVVIRIIAETNTRSSSQVDPARSAHYNRARAELRKIYGDRAAAGKLRWSLTIFPTEAYAQDAEMSLGDYEEFLIAACKLDDLDPVTSWIAQRTEQARLIEWLSPRKQLHLVGPDTDLSLSIEDRIWINSDGKRNFPSGEVFTGPVEDSANGYIRCSFPVIEGGREIVDIRLKFENGMVVDASAARNEPYLLQMLDTDPGARRLGEAAIGTNFGINRFTRQILLDEKIGGTAHVALGSGYPETGSSNHSAIHWDLICDLRDGGRIEADGEPIMVDGAIVI